MIECYYTWCRFHKGNEPHCRLVGCVKTLGELHSFELYYRKEKDKANRVHHEKVERANRFRAKRKYYS